MEMLKAQHLTPMSTQDLTHDLRAALMAARKSFKLEGEPQPLDQFLAADATEALLACGDLTETEAEAVREFLTLGGEFRPVGPSDQQEEIQRIIDDLNAIALARSKG